MKAKDPETGIWFYFVDKCMLFGSNISCAHFQAFSNAIAHVMKIKSGKENVNYLDDFLFIALLKWLCNQQIQQFLDLCESIKFPVALEKTFWVTTLIAFLGMLIDTEKQIILLPKDKVERALLQIRAITNHPKRKSTVPRTQKLCGLLNFLCRAIYPGRPFLTRVYATLSGMGNKLKPHHHITIPHETINDLKIWEYFLSTPEAYSRPFIDLKGCESAVTLDWFTDSAKAQGKGFGGHYKSHWFHGVWDDDFLIQEDPSIEFLELYAVTISILLWSKEHKNQRIVLFCDNESMVFMLNRQSSRCRNCLVLIRLITLQCLVNNVRIYTKHVRTFLNDRADALSRNKVWKFKQISERKGVSIDLFPTKIPQILANINNFWLH